ncbi:MAG: SCO family protein [Bacteroidetes bacterium]|nr:MAG: SCO family protein [Bacteroidota bacterium]
MKTKYIFLMIVYLMTCISYSNAEFGRKPSVGLDEQLGKKIPLNLKFVNSNGDTSTLGSLINKPTVLALVYYHCPNICTPLLNGLSETLDRMDMDAGKEYRVITISFDQYETPAIANKWKNNYLAGMKKRIPADAWLFMVGDSTSIKTLTDAVGFYFERDSVEDFIHPSTILVLSPKGVISRYLFGTTFLPFDLKMALIEASEGKSSPTINKVLQFCFDYDKKGKTYVFNFNRVAGGILLLFVIVFLSILLVKGRKNNIAGQKK